VRDGDVSALDGKSGRKRIEPGLRERRVLNAMPYKYNESRRHRIPKAKYGVTN
jgi:hypothetical protein